MFILQSASTAMPIKPNKKQMERAEPKGLSDSIYFAFKQPIMDLSNDDLNDFCDRLNLKKLCIISRKCKRHFSFARASFSRRKLTGITNWKDERDMKKIFTTNSELIEQLMWKFGDYIESMHFDFDSLKRFMDQFIFRVITRYCIGTLRILYLRGSNTTMNLLKDISQLLASLTELGLFEIQQEVPTKDCHQLSVLKVFCCSASVEKQTFKSTFPKLKHFVFWPSFDIEQYNFDEFIGRHPQLTSVDICVRCDTPLLSQLENLHCLSLSEVSGRVLGIGPKRLKELSLRCLLEHSQLLECIDRLIEKLSCIKNINIGMMKKSLRRSAYDRVHCYIHFRKH